MKEGVLIMDPQIGKQYHGWFEVSIFYSYYCQKMQLFCQLPARLSHGNEDGVQASGVNVWEKLKLCFPPSLTFLNAEK